MRFHSFLLASIFTLLTATAFAQTASVASRLAPQNELFEQQYQSDLKLGPEQATQRGDYRYNSLLSDYSMAGQMRAHAADENFVGRLKAISTEGFSDQDKLSHELLLRSLQQRMTDYSFKDWEMPRSHWRSVEAGMASSPSPKYQLGASSGRTRGGCMA